MATETVTRPNKPDAMPDKVIAGERANLALEALYGAMALTGAVKRELEEDTTDGELAAQFLLRTIQALHGVVLDALDANEMDLEEMRAVVHGGASAEEVAHG